MRKIGWLLLFCTGCAGGGVNETDVWSQVGEIEKQIVAPQFRDVDYSIADYGAVADGQSDALPAIRSAVDRCSSDGGGRVVIPAGRFFCKGPVVLKSNVNLHFETGAELIFSADEEDYLPVVLTRWEGTEVYNYSPLIYAYQVKNIAITGSGVINGQGSLNFARWKPLQKPDQRQLRAQGTAVVPVCERVYGQGHFLRPALIEPVACDNVLIEGVKIVDATFWSIHLIACQNVIVRNVTVDSTNLNNDGCDPESSRNVLIEDCFFRTGDDAIAIKSGRDNDAWRIGQPTENVIIRNCVFDTEVNGLCIGSEVSGGVRNVFAENIRIKHAGNGLYFKSNLDRGGYISRVYVRNVTVDSVSSALVRFEPDYKSESRADYPTLFRDFLLEDITAKRADGCGIDVAGFDALPVQNVTIRRLTLDETPVPLRIRNVSNLLLDEVMINGESFDREVK